MLDLALTEEALLFGEGGRLLGVLTRPACQALNAAPHHPLPVFVFLTAGLVHRIGPHRLHVCVARKLAEMGFASLRVDLAGVGDSPLQRGLTNEQSVALDFADILQVIELRCGRVPLVLAGLCSGADNAVILAVDEPSVVGMLLLDPVCFPDPGLTGFKTRALISKYANPAQYFGALKRRCKALAGDERSPLTLNDSSTATMGLRFPPTREQMRAAFEAVRARGGRVLSVFTGTAPHYNKVGQLGRVLCVEHYDRFCTELFWSRSDHTFTLELHRRTLIEAITHWAHAFANPAAVRERASDRNLSGSAAREVSRVSAE